MRRIVLVSGEIWNYASARWRLCCTVSPVSSRRWGAIVISSSLGVLLGIALIVFTIDPYQVYRRPTLYKPLFADAYNTIPGIIRNYDYDGIVLGSSMCQNFRLSEVEACLGWRKGVKLTPSGCTPATVNLFFTLASKRQPLRHALYGLDIFGFSRPVDEHRIPLPDYLYDDDIRNDYLYLWNRNVLYEGIPDVLKAIAGRKKYRLKQNEDEMWAWDLGDGRREYGENAVVHAEKRFGGALKGNTLPENAIEAMLENLDVNILGFVKDHPEVDIVVFFPPYSIQAWHNLNAVGNMDTYLEFKEKAVERLLGFPNVRVYDFQIEKTIVCDFANYRDGTHYSPQVGTLILERMGRDENRVTNECIQKNNTLMRQLVKNYEASGAIVP